MWSLSPWKLFRISSLLPCWLRICLQCRRPGFDPWVGKIPCRRAWQPTPVFLPGESPGTEEPGGLQSMGLQRVGHDWATKHSTQLYNVCCSVAQSCPTLLDPMDCSMPSFPLLHHLPELAQTHVSWVNDAIHPPHPLLPASSPAFDLSHHQSFPVSRLFASGDQNIVASASASVLPMNSQGCFLLGLTGLISL